MTETISEQEKRQTENERERRNKQLGIWNPKAGQARINYMNWLKKQAEQRQKTLELDGVTHSREYKDRLREEKKYYMEEYKRVKDLVEDGK